RLAREEIVASLVVEARQHLVRRRLNRGGDERIDLGGLGRRGPSEQNGDDCKCAHEKSLRNRQAGYTAGRCYDCCAVASPWRVRLPLEASRSHVLSVTPRSRNLYFCTLPLSVLG